MTNAIVPDMLGFNGLGVMGEAMCRNLARKSGARVVAYDVRPAPLAALASDGVTVAASAREVAAAAHTVFLCLPGEPQARARCAGGLRGRLRPGQILVDMSTAPVALACDPAKSAPAAPSLWMRAVARTARAPATARCRSWRWRTGAFARVRPLLACMGTEVTTAARPVRGRPSS